MPQLMRVFRGSVFSPAAGLKDQIDRKRDCSFAEDIKKRISIKEYRMSNVEGMYAAYFRMSEAKQPFEILRFLASAPS